MKLNRIYYIKGLCIMLLFLVGNYSFVTNAQEVQDTTIVGSDTEVYDTEAANTETDTISEIQRMGSDTKQDTVLSGEELKYNALVLDDAHTYSGMKNAYKKGYVPEVENNKVKIVLPLYFKEASKVNSIQAKVDLGTVDNSPFIYKNYSKSIQKNVEKIDDWEKEVFLVKFNIGLQKKRVNGVYPVTIAVSYFANDAEMTQEFVVYVSITDGKESGDEEVVTEEETVPTSEPKLIIVKNELSEEKILSGSNFTSTITLKNTNKNKYIQNITITVSCENEGISLCDDMNVFYFEKIAADSTLELPIKLMVDESVLEGKYKVKLFCSYDNPQATSLSSEGEFSFQVYQNMRVELESGSLPEDINAGDSVSVPVQVMNLGRSTIYNVRCNVEGTGVSASKSLYIGNLEGGTAGSGELMLFAGMVNPDAEEEADRYGAAYGKLVMTYEDAEGNVYTEETEYYTNIIPIKVENNNSIVQEKETTIGRQLMIGMIVMICIVAIATVTTIVIHNRKKSGNYEGTE